MINIYNLNHGTRSKYSCEESGCNSEGICRCGIVVGINVKEEQNDLIEEIKKLNCEIDEKQIKELFKKHGLFNSDNYDFIAESDYYGEELKSITFKNEEALRNDIINYNRYSQTVNVSKLKRKILL